MGCGSSKLKSLPDGQDDVSYEKSASTDRVRKKLLKESGGKKADVFGKTPKYRTKVDSRVIAKYDIKALLGKGAFSDVLRVENKLTKQPFAIKILRLRGADSRELFESELDVLKNIQHPLIIKLAEVFEAKDHVYLVMELATGGELYDRIKAKGHYPEKEAIRVLQMILDGVGYLHENGITHRDLKPENLLFYHPGQDSKILITDFGFAVSKLKSEGSMFTTFCGTPEYIAPEVLSKKPYTNSVDMWAIGVVAFVMLSGHLPFPSDTTAKLFAQIVSAEFSFTREVWKTVSQEAKDFISKLLVVDYTQRLKAKDAVKIKWITSVTPLPVFQKSSTFSQQYAKYASQLDRNQLGKSQRSTKSNKVFQTRRRASSSAISDSQLSHSTGRMSQTQQKYLEVSGRLLEHNGNGALLSANNLLKNDRSRSPRHSPYVQRNNPQHVIGSPHFALESVTDMSDSHIPPLNEYIAASSVGATEDTNSIAIPSIDVSHSVANPSRGFHIDRNALDSISSVSSATEREEYNTPNVNGYHNGGVHLTNQLNNANNENRLDARKIAHLDALFSPHRKGVSNSPKQLPTPGKEKVGVWLEDQIHDIQNSRLAMPNRLIGKEGLSNGFSNSFGQTKPLSLPPLNIHVARPTLAVPPAVELGSLDHHSNDGTGGNETFSSSRTFLTATNANTRQDLPSSGTSQGGFNSSPRSSLSLLHNALPPSIS